MRLSASNVLLTTLGCVLVGGCSIFAPKRVAISSPAIEKAQLVEAGEASAISSEVTNAGRAQLDAEQPGLAIDTFRKALAKGEAPAAALNGLGVAYARIGRQDLAIWYFKQAMVVDPGNTRYAMNIERVLGEAGTAPTVPNQLVEASDSASRGDNRAGAPAFANTSIRRVARPEIKIVTALPQSRATARAVRITTSPYPARVPFVAPGNPATKSRWVDGAPNRARITTTAPYPARIDFADRVNPAIKSRWIDVAPTRTRITNVGSPPPVRKHASTVRMAAIDLR